MLCYIYCMCIKKVHRIITRVVNAHFWDKYSVSQSTNLCQFHKELLYLRISLL